MQELPVQQQQPFLQPQLPAASNDLQPSVLHTASVTNKQRTFPIQHAVIQPNILDSITQNQTFKFDHLSVTSVTNKHFKLREIPQAFQFLQHVP